MNTCPPRASFRIKCGKACCTHHLSLDYAASNSQILMAYNNKGLFLAPVPCSLWFGCTSLFWKGDVRSAPIWAWQGGQEGGEGRTQTHNGSQSFYALVCHFQSHPIGQTSHACRHQGGECDRPTGKSSKPSGIRTEPAAIIK